ncbi:hypothetical protein BC567DRAFT_7903 [Phyllosticta citribraziliensis]
MVDLRHEALHQRCTATPQGAQTWTSNDMDPSTTCFEQRPLTVCRGDVRLSWMACVGRAGGSDGGFHSNMASASSEIFDFSHEQGSKTDCTRLDSCFAPVTSKSSIVHFDFYTVACAWSGHPKGLCVCYVVFQKAQPAFSNSRTTSHGPVRKQL